MPLFLDPLFTAVAAAHLMVDTFNASRPVLLTYLGLRETEIALISTLYIWASSLAQPFFGWLSDRMGPRWPAAGGLLWITAFFSAAVIVEGPAGLALLIIAGLGSAAFHPVGAVQATLKGRDRLEGKETTAAAVFFMAGQSGHFIGPILTGVILTAIGLPGLLVFAVIAVPLGVSLAWQLRGNLPHPAAAPADSEIGLRAGARFVVALALVAGLQSWAQTNIVNLMPKYLRDLGQAPTVYGAFAGLFMGGSALGNFVGGYLGDRFPKRYVTSIALMSASVPIFLLSRIGWSPWLYVLVPLAGFFTGAVHSNLVILAQRVIPGGMALASGLALGFIFSAGAVGMLLTGPIAESEGFPVVLRITSGLVLSAAVLALLLKEAPSRKPVPANL